MEGKNQALLSSLSESLTLPEDTYILVADQLVKHRWINRSRPFRDPPY